MRVQTKDFVDVAARSQELGCRVPVRISLLPGNFSTAAGIGEFCFHAATPYVRVAWQSIGLEDEGPDFQSGTRDLGLGTSSGIRENGDCAAAHPVGCSEGLSPFSQPQCEPNSESTQLPLIVFFGAGLLDGSAWRVTGALGMVSSVFASRSRYASPSDVQLEVVVERPGERGCACIEYQGDAFGIVALVGEVRRIWPDSQWQEPRQISGLPR